MAEVHIITYTVVQNHNSWVVNDEIDVYVNTADNTRRVEKNSVTITSGDDLEAFDETFVTHVLRSSTYILDNGQGYRVFPSTDGVFKVFPYIFWIPDSTVTPPGQKKLHKFEFRENAGTWTTSDVLETFWDENTGAIVVKKNGTVITSGEDLSVFAYTSSCNNILGIGCKKKIITTDFNYSFCDGTDYNDFFTNVSAGKNVFPYSKRTVTTNSPICNTNTCDIAFSGSPTVTNASGSGNNDGSLSVTATSSGANIEYGLDNFTYGTGQINGTFVDLYTGTYTVYAKDANGCSTFTWVTVGVDEVATSFGVKYRIEYNQINGYYSSKVDILERGYAGAIEELTSTSDPFTLSWNGDGSLDKFKPITASEARIGAINTTAQGSFYYRPVFTSDERSYKVKKYINEGSEVLEWEGFIIPFLHSEPYLDTPYEVYFTATDGLADLHNFDFTDKDGNTISGNIKAIKVIAECLKKTDLTLNIRVACNIYETNHAQLATDDPLDQTYVDALAYEGMNCKEVLEAILKPFQARLYVANGLFHVVRTEEQAAAYDYREFDIEGDYVSNGSFNPVVDLKAASFTDRAVFVDRSPVLEVLPSFRKITINQLLGPKEALIENGDFEDFLTNETGVVTNRFPEWFLKLNGNTGTYLQESPGNNGGRCVRFFGGSFPTPDKFPYIESTAYPIDFSEGDKISFSLHYFMDAYPGLKGDAPPRYAKFKYSVKMGNYYLKSSGDWTTDPNQEWITKFIKSPNTGWQSLDITADVPADGSGDLIIKLQEDFLQQSAYDDATALKAVSTHNKPEGFITWAYYTVSGSVFDDTYLAYYELTTSLDAESLPDTIRPNDFKVDTYQYSLAAGNNSGNNTVVVNQAISGPNQTGALSLSGDLYFFSSWSGSTFNLTSTLTKSYDTNGPVSVSANRVVWKKIDQELKSTEGVSGYLGQYRVEKFDDVVFRYLPGGEEPPDSKKISLTNNVRIKNDFEEDYFHGDVHGVSAGRYIYRNYFRLSDGTPTGEWTRDGVAEATEILKIALKGIASQYGVSTNKISGTMLSDKRVTILSTLNETFDSNRKYILSGLTINDKEGTYDFEMYELRGSASAGGGGSTFTGDFNADFGVNFDTILN